MKVQINDKLLDLYKTANKNINYSLGSILASLDVDTCKSTIEIVEELKLLGNRVEIEIDEDNINVINNLFEHCDASTVEKLLWVALLFPEI